MINLFILYIHLPGSQGRSWKSVYNPAILQKPLRIAQSYSKSPLSNHFDFLEIADKILPYYKAWYDSCPECEYLLHTED